MGGPRFVYPFVSCWASGRHCAWDHVVLGIEDFARLPPSPVVVVSLYTEV